MNVLGEVTSILAKKSDHWWIEDIKFSPDNTQFAFGTHGGLSKIEFVKVEDNGKIAKGKVVDVAMTSALQWTQKKVGHFPKKSWTSTQKKLNIIPKKIGHLPKICKTLFKIIFYNKIEFWTLPRSSSIFYWILRGRLSHPQPIPIKHALNPIWK